MFSQNLHENLFFSRNQLSGTFVGERTRFTLAVGMNHTRRRHHSALTLSDSGGSVFALPRFVNEVTLQFSKYFLLAQVFYQHKNQKINVTFEPDWVLFSARPSQSVRLRFRRLAPLLRVDYQAEFHHEQAFRLILSHTNRFPLLSDFYLNPYFRNYRTCLLYTSPSPRD